MVVSIVYYSCMSQTVFNTGLRLTVPGFGCLTGAGSANQGRATDRWRPSRFGQMDEIRDGSQGGRTTEGVGGQGLRGPRSGYSEGRSGGAGACVLQDVSSKTGNDGWGRVTSP
ncbi:unnamed protein product [Calypogeia fissa]